jgi:3-methyladenine DNA glycosylase AlkD
MHNFADKKMMERHVPITTTHSHKKMEEIEKHLFSLQDIGYRDFHAKLVPNIDKERIIGVRTPALRRYARELAKSGDRNMVDRFMEQLPHRYYDEMNLHGALIGLLYDDVDVTIAALDRFLPYVDNWATCDMLGPKIFARHPEEVLEAAERWLGSAETYTVRFGIVTLMHHFLDAHFEPKFLSLVANIDIDDYYVRMAQAWYFSFALIKQWDAALPYLTERQLSQWVHNKSIQKALESYRVDSQQKDELRQLRW